MKKIIFAVVVAAVALVSCSKKDSRSCYHVEYIIPAQEEQKDADGVTVRKAREEIKIEAYKWATSAEIDACRKNWESMGYKNVLTKEANEIDGKEVKTMADCLSN